MTLAMLHGDMGWVRAEILDCDQETEAIYVLLIDFGTEEWVTLRPDNILFKYLPLHLKQIPSQALTLQLPLVSDLDEDTLLSLMAENILSETDINPCLTIRFLYSLILPHHSNFSGSFTSVTLQSMDTWSTRITELSTVAWRRRTSLGSLEIKTQFDENF